MKVTLIQTQLYWENKDKNLEHFENLVNSITEPTDLIVLPEMFTTGFTMDPSKLADPLNGASLQWMAKKAIEKRTVLCGSVAVEDKGNFYNRLFWVEPSGSVSVYNKRHLFRMAGEDKHYAMGAQKIVKSLNGWNVCPLVCYDLRFPVW